jgi:hypothetical protein
VFGEVVKRKILLNNELSKIVIPQLPGGSWFPGDVTCHNAGLNLPRSRLVTDLTLRRMEGTRGAGAEARNSSASQALTVATICRVIGIAMKKRLVPHAVDRLVGSIC